MFIIVKQNFILFYTKKLYDGLRIIGSSTAEFTLVDYPPMDDWLSKDNVLKSNDRLKQEMKYT